MTTEVPACSCGAPRSIVDTTTDVTIWACTKPWRPDGQLDVDHFRESEWPHQKKPRRQRS